MRDEGLIVGELAGAVVVSVIRIEGVTAAPSHAYELHRDGVVLGTFETLKDIFSYLHTERV